MNTQRNLLWGLIGVALAITLLLRALGVIPDNVFDVLARAAPALLVFAGLAWLLRDRLPFSSVIALGMASFLTVNVALIAYSVRAGQLREDNQVPISQTVDDDITLLRVELELLSTDVSVLFADARTVSGAFVGSTESALEVSYVADGLGGAVLRIMETRPNALPNLEAIGRGRLDIRLPPDLATDILVNVGQGTATLDLGNIDLERLNVNIGRGDARVVLPTYAARSPDVSGNGTINLQGGSLTLFVPRQVGLRVEFPTASAADPQVDETVYNILRDGTVESRQFDSATIQLRYVVRVPGGRVTVTDAAQANVQP